MGSGARREPEGQGGIGVKVASETLRYLGGSLPSLTYTLRKADRLLWTKWSASSPSARRHASSRSVLTMFNFAFTFCECLYRRG